MNSMKLSFHRLLFLSATLFVFLARPMAGRASEDLTGTWRSNMGSTYNIVRTDEQFAWTDSTGGKGTIAFTPEGLDAKWTDAAGPHSAKGKITETDAGGRPAKIDWDNGVVFQRSGSSGMPGVSPQMSKVDPNILQGQQKPLPAPERNAPGEVDPYLITLFKDVNYVNPIATYRLDPGMKMRRLPGISPLPASIFMGSRVAAILFPNGNFSSIYHFLGKEDRGLLGLDSPSNKYYYLAPYLRLAGSSQSVTFPAASIVFYRKDIQDWLGIYLETNYPGGYVFSRQFDGPDSRQVFISSEGSGQFYPLPDDPSLSSMVYPKVIPPKAPLKMHFIAGGDGQWSLFGSPSPKQISVTIAYPGQGASEHTFPESESMAISYELDKFGIPAQISSISIKYLEPPAAEYSSQVRVVAPPASDAVGKHFPGEGTRVPQGSRAKVPRTGISQKTGSSEGGPDISGQWNSSLGPIYQIDQTSLRFEWRVASTGEKGEGTIKGNEITVTWSGPGGSGSAQGKIAAIDPSGKATRIDWSNGVSFYR